MAQITAALVKELREKSGAGMMDCKKALSENDGDLESAVDWLRKNGLAAAAKKAGRVAAEGLVAVATSGTKGAAVEVNAETDFVSRNEKFQSFVKAVAELSLNAGGDVEALSSAAFPGESGTVADALTNRIATIGEHMSLRRTASLEVKQGVVASYIHNQTTDGLGKIGVLVALESAGDAAKLEAFGKQVAMHIAATNPLALDRSAVDASALERERDIIADQARASGKPEEIIGKMVEGRLRKYYEEVCLLEQNYVIDGENTVGKAVELFAKDLGAAVALTGFVRFQLGEGIEKKEEDFAAEVAATLGN
ncbi:translation elongation factor Ts [Kiloniella laminariae]|uniref:Elongation factor Ts n=1 Tax=Kiloniella laminariae TaxID=454162 RepID=A0ABT4LLN8_9PROT|nr:translation elongation factor Ts [Kiloniella laminariae]MCZ4282023.1 translation elongation factor Ts [Kiloniella laminariae]